jgi:hypothetical protein
MLCLICKRLLNNPNDPLSMDCGGDCLQCMADAGDPDCIRHVEELKRNSKGNKVLIHATPAGMVRYHHRVV